VETNLATNTILSIIYTGTKGTHLDMLLAPNRPAPGSTSTSSQVANAGDFIYDTSDADSMFNSLQVRVQQRTTHGIGGNVIYTYGKSMDDASSIGGGTGVVVQDPGNLKAEWGLSSFNVTQALRATYFYEIPLGDRHRFAQKGFSGAVLGNWRLSGNLTAHTGTPFTATVTGGANNTGGSGAFATRANQICNPNLPAGERTPLDFFNTACFVAPPAGQYGDAARNTIIGPGSFVWNLQMAKWFPFGHDNNHRVDVRWEVTNLTNTPNFNGLSTLVGSSTFGRITGAGGMRTMDVVTRFNW
jgi:trimeric autotransporter adhesin